jgi:hypothetical protein
VLTRLLGQLSPGIEPCPPEEVERRFVLVERDDGWHYYSAGPEPRVLPDRTLAMSVLDAELRRYVAIRAPDWVFIHAGAVAHRGRAILIPGTSFSGKSTLVAELVRRGATYYSDEYAILDERGLVRPYARPLSIRPPESLIGTRHTAESIGGSSGEEPIPVGLIAIARYRPTATWSPERRSRGHGMMTLLAHAMPRQDRPEEALAAARRAASTALVLEGERGEADVTAEGLLDFAGNLPDGPPGD